MPVIEILTVFLNSVINFLPNLVGAMILLLVGWIIGLVVGRVIKEILKKTKVDEYIARGKRPIFRISSILSVIFTWSIYLIFIQSAIEVLGIAALTTAVEAILEFLPGLIKAITVLVIGYVVGEYIRQQIEESKVVYSDIVSKLIFFVVIYIAIAMSVPLVGIDPFLINALLLVMTGSVGAGLAIAIGLGLKDSVAKIVKRYQREHKG